MTDQNTPKAAETNRRLYAFNGGLLAKNRVRRILELSGWDVSFGKPGPDDPIGVWGMSPTSPRGEAVADLTGSPLVRVEDAFLRSLFPGRSGEPPLGLLVDDMGVHFDSSRPSALEHLLANHAFDDTALLNRARDAMDFMKDAHLSKYCAVDPELDVPDAGFVLVIDQTRGDASIQYGGALSTTFREMLVFAQMEHPDAKIVIKAHPEENGDHRPGHFTSEDENDRISILRDPVSPWKLFDHARAVYTVSSGMGFEAIIGGHKPRVFGQPFYAGWGLTQDENPVGRRERKLTRAQLFAGAMILSPKWYDPFEDRLTDLESTLRTLDASARAWRQDRKGWIATGISAHKRKRLQHMFGKYEPVQFAAPQDALTKATASGKPLMAWASRMDGDFPLRAAQENVDLFQLEDGFIRSRGLGAALVPPMSLVLDDLGIYYDPLPESGLERLIQASADLPKGALDRAFRLRNRINKTRLSKYNQGKPVDATHWPEGPRVLVVGQVEDDASILSGATGKVKTNKALLQAARIGVPNGVLIYKPHPDTVQGFRKGAIDPGELATLADVVLSDEDPVGVLDQVEAVWTMTSLLGFEALLRGLPVTCVGAPFYAGWGLTRDFGPVSGRRTARPTLDGLVHATLIDYPRYFDPVTGLACPPEVVVNRLAEGGETPGLRGSIWSVWRRWFAAR